MYRNGAMIWLVLFLFFGLWGCTDRSEKITISGVAQNALAGAVVVTANGGVYYISGMNEWSASKVGTAVTVEGVLKKIKGEELKAPNGEYKQGIEGEQLVIERPVVSKAASYSLMRGDNGATVSSGKKTSGLPVVADVFVSVTECGVARQEYEPNDPRETCTIGTLKPGALGNYSGRKIVDALLYGGDIATYIHLSSTFCLVSETDNVSEYKAHFTGTHAYCTNDCYNPVLDFTVTINKSTRVVSATY